MFSLVRLILYVIFYFMRDRQERQRVEAARQRLRIMNRVRANELDPYKGAPGKGGEKQQGPFDDLDDDAPASHGEYVDEEPPTRPRQGLGAGAIVAITLGAAAAILFTLLLIGFVAAFALAKIRPGAPTPPPGPKAPGPVAVAPQPVFRPAADPPAHAGVPPVAPPVAPAPLDKRPPPMPPQMALVASNLGQFLCFAADPRDGAAFLAYKDGSLKRFGYPAFTQEQVYHINGQAYQAVVDPNKGLLYAVVAKPNSLNPHPYAKHRLQAIGDLHVYNLQPLLQHKADAPVDVRPARVIPLAARVPDLYISADGRWVYFLDATDRRNARLRRIDTDGADHIEDLKLADGMEVLRVCPDDPTRMVAASSNGSVEEDFGKPGQYPDRLQVIDAAKWAVVKTIPMRERFYDMDVGPGGRAFLSPWKDLGRVLVVSLDTGDQVAIWDGFQSADFILVSRNGKRLYREKQFGSPIGVDCWALPEKPTGLPRTGLQPREGTEQDASRGEMVMTADGKFLLFKSGTVFALLGAVD